MAKKKKPPIHSTQVDALLVAGVTGNDGSASGISVEGNGTIVGDNSANNIIVKGGTHRIKAGGGNDKIKTGNGKNTIWGDSGNDKIKVGNGKGWIKAGSGNDKIKAGKGPDKIWGNGGRDKIVAGEGKNKIVAGSGNDVVKTGNGNDKVVGGGGHDKIYAGSGSNFVNAGSGNDRIVTGDRNDKILGGGGRDLIIGGLGSDYIDGGAGIDTVIVPGSVSNYTFIVAGLANVTLQNVASATVTTVKNVEVLKFSDRIVYLDGRNNAPFAKNIAVALNEDSTVQTINLLTASSAFDIDGTPLSVTGITPNGTVLGSVGFDAGTYELTYDPGTAFDYLNTGQTATESVSFTISDGTATITKTVTFTIAGITKVNPTAQDDAFATDENTTINGNVLDDNGNGADTDLDGDTFTVIEVNGLSTLGTPIMLGSGALVTMFADGTFIYDLNDAFDYLTLGTSGADSFTYTIRDSSGLSDTATVAINIDGALNEAPTAVNDTFQVVEGQLGTFAPLDNDTDPENDGLSIIAIDGFSISAGQTVNLGDGTSVTLNADGTITFNQNGQFDLLPGQSQFVSFGYDMQDTNGHTSSANIDIEITGDLAPVVTNDTAQVVENATVTFAPLDNDSDPEGGALTITQLNGQVAQVGVPISIFGSAQVTLNADGTLTFDPNGAYNPAPGETVPVSFDYVVTDTAGNLTTGQIDIDVVGNEFPVAANDDINVVEQGSFTFDPRDNDNDPEGGALTIVAIDGTPLTTPGQVVNVSFGSVTFNADGTLTFTAPPGLNVDPGSPLLTSFSYDVQDDMSQTSTAQVNVTIVADEPPVVVDDTESVFETQTVTFAPLADDSDPEGGALTITAVDGLSITSGQTVVIGDGALVTLNPDGTLTYDPNGQYTFLTGGQTTPTVFQYDVTDSFGNVSSGNITIDVNGSAPPVANDDTAQFALDQPITINVLANDTDLEGDALTITHINGLPISVGNPVTLASDAEVSLNVDGTLTYDPLGTTQTSDSFNYEVTDGSGESSFAQVNITDPLIGRSGPPAGGGANEVLNGTSGDDVLSGQAGDDQLFGNAGNDVLAGGTGTDQLTGGLGADRFVFSAGDGNDTITDFEVGSGDDIIDVLELAGFGTSFAALDTNGDHQLTAADSTVTASADGLTLHLGPSDTLTLDYVGALKEGHVLFT